MALTKCHECKAEISSEAIACPKCGAKPPKETSRFTLAVGGLFAIAVAMGVANSVNHPETATPAVSAADAEADTRRVATATEAANAIKRVAREPESVKFEALGVSDDAQVVCMQYRARNGFGGMAREFAIFSGNRGSTATAAAWAKKCTALRDYLYAVN